MADEYIWVFVDPRFDEDTVDEKEESTMNQPNTVKPNGKLEYALHCAILNQIDKVEECTSDLQFVQEDFILQQQCESYVELFGGLPGDIIRALEE